jgi:hypothetical protein
MVRDTTAMNGWARFPIEFKPSCRRRAKEGENAGLAKVSQMVGEAPNTNFSTSCAVDGGDTVNSIGSGDTVESWNDMLRAEKRTSESSSREISRMNTR